MAAVDAGEVRVIVAYSQSRLWRFRPERADGFGRLAKAKVRLEFVKGASYDFKDATSRMVAGIIGKTDSWFAEITSESQRATAADHAERGAYHGKRPFGFDRVAAPGEKRGVERSLVANEKEARYLREAYRMADPEGEARSLWEICITCGKCWWRSQAYGIKILQVRTGNGPRVVQCPMCHGGWARLEHDSSCVLRDVRLVKPRTLPPAYERVNGKTYRTLGRWEKPKRVPAAMFCTSTATVTSWPAEHAVTTWVTAAAGVG